MQQKNSHINSFLNKSFLIITMLSLVFLCLFVKLSIWQFFRAKEKTIILNKIQTAITQDTNQIPNLSINQIISNTNNDKNISEYSLVRIPGYFDTKNILLLGNQFHNHQLGYNIVIPFSETDSNFCKNSQQEICIKNNSIILINAGWISEDALKHKDISKLFPVRKTTITGLLRESNTHQYIMGNNLSNKTAKTMPDAYRQIQKIDLTDSNIRALFKNPLAYHYIQLINPQISDLKLNWQWTNIPPEKHKGYALQWLILAISVIFLYSYFCYKNYQDSRILTKINK